jgi:hypothetical protein
MRTKRIQETYVFDGVAVDVDFVCLQPWSLIDVGLNLDVAATTSENVTIYRKDVDQNDWYQGGFDPSTLSAPEDVSKICRFDKRFQAGDTLRVDFANTDARTITVCIQYELDHDTDYDV